MIAKGGKILLYAFMAPFIAIGFLAGFVVRIAKVIAGSLSEGFAAGSKL